MTSAHDRALDPDAVARDDRELMMQIASGSADAFERLYERYGARAYRVARSVCGESGRAEEAVQEAFASIWRNGAGYRSERGTVAAWLLTVVRYRAIDVARRNGHHAGRRAEEALVKPLPAPSDTSEQAVSRADGCGLNALLGRLPDAQREVIVLAFYGELTHTEIAVQLGLPAGTVKGRMRLGLGKLRDHMGQVSS